MSINVLKEEFAGNQYENSFIEIQSRYKQVRRLRRDGNCFYRAFLFQFFEWFILNKHTETGKKAYLDFLKTTEESKVDLVANAGYDDIAIDDFY